MKTVVLTTCNNAVEANLIKGMLENNGIECFLTNENFSNLMPFYNGIMGSGVQVVIDENDLVRAKELLAYQSKPDEIVCPECGSHNIEFSLGSNKLKKLLAIILSLFCWAPFGNIRNTYYCNDCNTEFKR